MNPPESPPTPPVALSIAGFDPSNGAGITADLQVFAAHGLFGTSAITALTVQSTVGVASVSPVDPAHLRQTLRHLTSDLPPAGIKIGMLATSEIVATIAYHLHVSDEKLAPKPEIPLVLDPILMSSSGTSLLSSAGVDVLHSQLLPRVTWITPNWAELDVLSGREVHSLEDAAEALNLLGQRYPRLHIVATGGDADTPTDLLRLPSGEFHRFPGVHIESESTHGTGCAFSSALLSRLILGDSPVEAVAAAKSYVTGAILHAPGLGSGPGPLDLLWNLRD